MRVDLRRSPALLNVLAPSIHRKDGNLTSLEVQQLLADEYGMQVTINRGDHLYVVEMDEETFTWVSLKWGIR